MTKADILEYFKDLNHVYNDCTKLDTLSKMLDEFKKEKPKKKKEHDSWDDVTGDPFVGGGW